MTESIGNCKLCGEEVSEENIDRHFLDRHNASDIMGEGFYWLVQG